MVLLVLMLLCSCLTCLRDGVWTKYTPADVARWHARPAPAPPPPAAARQRRGFFKPV